MVVISVLYGILSYSIMGIAIFVITRGFYGKTKIGKILALFTAIMCSELGVILYLTLSGMETITFLTIGLLSILAYTQGRLVITGLLLGMLVLTRIEGLVLLIPIGSLFLYETWINGQMMSLKRLCYLTLFPIFILVLILVYNYVISQNLVPTTLIARKWLWGLPEQTLFSGGKEWINYFLTWATVLDDWFFQSYHLNGLPFLKLMYRVALSSLLLYGAFIFLRYTVRRDREKTGLVLLFWWFILHNSVYLILFPVASLRYQSITVVMVVILLVTGLFALYRRRVNWEVGRMGGLCLLFGLVTITIPLLETTRQWKEVYVAHVRHINNVHVMAGRWIDDNLPYDAVIAAFDIGAVKYYGNREITDISGLSNPEYARRYLYGGQVLDFMQQKRTTHLAMVETHDNRNGLGYRLGIYGDRAATRVHLVPLQSYEVPPYIFPPFNHLPDYYFYPAYRKIVIYQIRWSDR